MVSSRCVSGLSIGWRPVSASPTRTKASIAAQCAGSPHNRDRAAASLSASRLVLPTGSTNLLALSDAAARSRLWGEPAHWAAMLAFVLVGLAETGRQPIDNPDTHLELTMVHEG